MPYDGDLTMDCSGSDFEIGSITAYDSSGNELTDADAAESVLTVHDLGHGGDYTFIVEGGPYAPSGTYDCAIECSSDAPTKSPSTDPTPSPTKEPTDSPTAEPTKEPTVSPTTEPTDGPTEEPTDGPTLEPSKSPTSWPTPSPSTEPTPSPSDSPTTPSPTHPGEKICGDHFNGTFHGEAMNVEVRMPYDGDMIMDCSACGFEIVNITAYDGYNELTDGNPAGPTLEVSDLVHGGDYTCIIEGAPDVSEGKFDCKIECTSDAPTNSPTENPSTSPTPAPSVNPTVSPTKSPTEWPTVSPTPSPTDSPTKTPTSEPSDSPTTPAPTHPGEKTCDSQFSGSYNGEPMNVEVRMPYDGDLTMDCSESDFDIGSVTAYDSDNNELTDVDYAASILTVHDLVHGGDYWFTIDGADGVSSGNFDCIIQCSSDSP